MRLSALLLLLVLAACSACGGSPSSSDPLDNPEPVAEATPAPEPVASVQQGLGACVDIQRPATGTTDTTVRDASPRSLSTTQTTGTNTGNPAGLTNTGEVRHAVLWFDVAGSGIPSGATITSAKMSLCAAAVVYGPAQVINVHPLSTGTLWSEATVTWANCADCASPSQGTITTLPAATLGATVSTNSTDLVPLVQGWLTGSVQNDGVVLEHDGVVAGTSYASSEWSTVSQRPLLHVCYTVSSGPSCTDGIQNQDETGIDCGGSTCTARCGSGQGCSVTSDCASPLSCVSEVCGLLPDGSACSSAAQCQHGICGGGVCQPLGGESTAVLSSCTRTPDPSILPTTYSYGSDPTNLIDMYMPPGGCTGGCPLVVNVHGGGFTSDGGGRASSPLAYFCQVLAGSLGGIPPVACASIDYRLMSGNYPSTVNAYPAAVNDGLAAQAWIIANASSLGIDPTRIGWIGFSAGGHIACKVGKAGGVKRVGLWYSNLYFDQPSWWSASNPSLYNYLGCANGDSACVAANAPAVNCTPTWGDPPALLSHDELDSVVSEQMSLRYTSEAHAAGDSATVVIATGVNSHGYGPTYMGPFAPSTCTGIYNFWTQL